MFCTKCGQQIPEGTTQCPNCGKAVGAATAAPGDVPLQTSQPEAIQQPYPIPPTGNMQVKPKKKTGCLVGGIVGGVAAVFFVLILIFAVAGSGEDEKPDVPSGSAPSASQSAEETQKQTTEPPSTRNPEEVKQEYIASCKTYAYKEIARSPKEYIGKRAKFTGEVVQVQETLLGVELRVDVTKGEYGIYTDTIYVSYINLDTTAPRILEDDIITIYGEMKDLKTYTSIMGQQVTLPQIEAKYITINS